MEKGAVIVTRDSKRGGCDPSAIEVLAPEALKAPRILPTAYLGR